MNTSSQTAFQVGLLIVIGVVIFGFCYYFFYGAERGSNSYSISVLFKDAQGVDKQANVDLAGVKIGTVSSVGLSQDTGKAIVRLDIEKKYRIPKGSQIIVAGSLLGGASMVTISPPLQNGPLPPDAYISAGATVEGDETASLAALQAKAGGLINQVEITGAKANKLLDQVAITTQSINKILSDPRLRSSLFDSVQNIDLATKNGLLLTDQLRTTLAEDNAQVHGALGNVTDMTSDMKGITETNRSKINAIIANLNDTTATLSQLTTKTNEQLAKGQTIQNMSDTMANLKDASVKLDKITDDVESITGDKTVQGELKTTVHNVSVASGQTELLVQRLTALTGGTRGPAKRGDLQFQTRLDFSQDFRLSKFRTDFDLYAPLSNVDFARVGVYDITEGDKLNLQYGQVSSYNKLFTYRAGIYASKVGIGVDYDLFGAHALSFDLFDPNRPRLDVRERVKINKNASVTFGLDNVPRTNDAMLGLQLER